VRLNTFDKLDSFVQFSHPSNGLIASRNLSALPSGTQEESMHESPARTSSNKSVRSSCCGPPPISRRFHSKGQPDQPPRNPPPDASRDIPRTNRIARPCPPPKLQVGARHSPLPLGERSASGASRVRGRNGQNRRGIQQFSLWPRPLRPCVAGGVAIMRIAAGHHSFVDARGRVLLNHAFAFVSKKHPSGE